MKKIISLLLCLLMAAALLAGCGDSEQASSRRRAISLLNGESTERFALSTGTTLERVTLYDGDDIQILLAGITGTPEDFQLVLAVRNGSRRSISLNVDSLTVDGLDCGGWTSFSAIPSHSVELGYLYSVVYSAWYTPTDVGAIDLVLSVYDAESYEDLAGDLRFSLVTSAGPQEYTLPEGTLLFEERGVTLTLLGQEQGNYASELSFLAENHSLGSVYLSSFDGTVNGAPCDLWFYEEIPLDDVSIFSVYLYDDEYEPLFLASGDELVFDVELIDVDTYRTMATQSVTYVVP